MVKLSEILKSIDIIRIYKGQELDISGISYHSQKVAKGHVFVCIRGYKTDGHKYLANAVSNGAVVAIVGTIRGMLIVPNI